MDFAYTVKVYADAVECQLRSLESIPLEYKDAVVKEIDSRRPFLHFKKQKKSAMTN